MAGEAQIDYICRGGDADGQVGRCGAEDENVRVKPQTGKGKKPLLYCRINAMEGGKWVFIIAGSGIPPGKHWFVPPYSPPWPANEPDGAYADYQQVSSDT